MAPLAAELSFPVAVNCSEEVGEVPELYFTDAAYQSFAVPLSGSVPGAHFEGVLVLGPSVTEGEGIFTIAMVDQAGNLGDVITGGGTLYIEPPAGTPTPTNPPPTAIPTNTPVPTSTPTATPTNTPVPILQMVLSDSSSNIDASVASDGAAHGAGEAVFALRAGSEPYVRELGLMRWSLNGLPDAGQILSASLALAVSNNNTGANFTLELRPLTQARPYLPACDWERYNGIDDWPVDNAYLTAQAETVQGSVTVALGDTQVVLDLTGLLQGWLEGTQPNHGLALVAVQGGAPVDCAFHSAEAAGAALRPQLRIRYAGPEPGSADTVAPDGTVAFSASGAYTNQRQHQLQLTASDDQTDMATAGIFRLSADNTSWSTPQPMTETVGFTLKAGDGLKGVCEALGIPPVLHMGSCVDISRILVAAAAVANALGVDISDLPVAGAAPEWMSEKAVSIGTYVISSGIYTVLGTVPQVLGSPNVTELLTVGAEDVIGAAFAVEPDPLKAAALMIERIDDKRKGLGL